jgi:hypothetical protein
MKHTRAVRWFLPVAASAGALLTLAALLFHWHHGPVVKRSNYNRITSGMPRAEVETILGGRGIEFPDLPPLNYVDIVADEFPDSRPLKIHGGTHRVSRGRVVPLFPDVTWHDGRHMIYIKFDSYDDSGHVIGRSYGRRHDAWWLFRKLDDLGF